MRGFVLTFVIFLRKEEQGGGKAIKKIPGSPKNQKPSTKGVPEQIPISQPRE